MCQSIFFGIYTFRDMLYNRVERFRSTTATGPDFLHTGVFWGGEYDAHHVRGLSPGKKFFRG